MDTNVTVGLASEAIADLRREFASYGHHPSAEQWHALRALLETFDKLVEGRAEPALYLSALDPGVGKTSAVIAYLRRLMQSPDHRQAGVLLCLSRLDEIERLARALAGEGMTLAIRTSDDMRNALSTVDEVAEAQVLIITQQRLELVCRGRAFAEVSSLHYAGSPRALRIWDESFLPGRTVTMSGGDVSALLRWLERTNPEARDWAERLALDLQTAKDGCTVSVPYWGLADDGLRRGAISSPLRQRAGTGDTLADEDNQRLDDLLSLAGRTVSVRRNGRIPVPTLVSYRRTLPDDLLPLVVLDASGRVRATYDDLATTMPLVRLPKAEKDYSNLTIRVWDQGGGKSSFGRHAADKIIDAIADLIETSDEAGRWLVVGHKESDKVVDVEKLVRERLTPTKAALVDFITWGNHAATNAHAETSRVILAGTLFLPMSGYEALKRLCLDKDADELALADEDLGDTVIGEHGHYVLQALCRASVRKVDDGGAGACTAYLIASKQSGIRARLLDWFPGCHVEAWEPKGPKPLTGHAEKVFDYVTRWASEAKPGDKLKFSRVYGDLGIDRDVFRKEVRPREDLKAALAAEGIEEAGGTALMTHYRLVRRSRGSDV